MKTKNYEKNELIIFIIIIFFIIELFGIIYLFQRKEYCYYKISGIISNKDLVTIIVDKKEKRLINKSENLYLNNKNIKYEIKENRGVIVKKNNKKYYELLIELKLPKNTKSTDVLEFSIRNKKKRMIELLKQVWEGG